MPRSKRPVLPSASVREQQRGREAWNQARSRDAAQFFTLGYSGRKLDEIVKLLLDAGVRTLVDIRRNATSMHRPELSKTNLRLAVEGAGLAYVHAPDLGVPSDVRARAVEAGADAIWTWYDEHVVGPEFDRNFDGFLERLAAPAALMCVEVDPHDCHRHRLAIALERHGLKGFDL